MPIVERSTIHIEALDPRPGNSDRSFLPDSNMLWNDWDELYGIVHELIHNELYQEEETLGPD